MQEILNRHLVRFGNIVLDVASLVYPLLLIYAQPSPFVPNKF